MAVLLYRLGRACFEHRGRVLGAWLAVLAVLGSAALVFLGPLTNSFSIPGTESQRALESLRTDFPQASGASASIVVVAPPGQTLATPEAQAVVGGIVAEAGASPGVLAALPPQLTGAISPDGRSALVQVQFTAPLDDLTTEQKDAINRVGAAAEQQGYTVAAGGEIAIGVPELGYVEAIGVVVAALVLILTLGSLVAAGMTLLTALIGVAVGMAGLFSLSSVIDLSSTAPILALMLGLAVGIDYSLFITSRYRQNLAAGLDPPDAVGRAVGTAGSAVVFAGATVVIALAALSVANIPFLTVMGLAAAATVAVAVLVALTLSPALLAFAGVRALPRSRRTAGEARPRGDDGRGTAWAREVIRYRVPVLVAVIAGLGVLALPTQDLRLALPTSSGAPEGSSARQAYDLTVQGFGPGFAGQLVVVVDGTDPAAVAAGAQSIAADLGADPDVVAVTPPQPSPAGTTALLQVIPRSGPTDVATEELVTRIRDDVARPDGVDLAVTGPTAVGIDVSDRLAEALPRYLAIVVGLSFLLLMLAFRSILVPLKATIGFLLTIGATFGVTVAVFQWGWLAGVIDVQGVGPLISFLPILLVGILFGLAMDYEVFLVSRMREEFVHGSDDAAGARAAVVSGLGSGARVVSAAAVIMFSVFGGFVFIEDTTVKSIGFALAIGVLIDAFLVRMTLVPAVMSLLGRSAWWLPRWLDRILPDLDIEGAKLDRHLTGDEQGREPVLAGSAQHRR